MSAGPAQPRFSVVIPTLGRAKMLRGCLAALSRQDYPRERFEVVVVNDGGGPAVEEVASDWQRQLELELVSAAGAGPAAARNGGAARARGESIAFTDDDCEPAPGWLAALEPALDAAPGCAVGGKVVNGARSRCAEGSQTVLDATHAHFNRDPAAPAFFATSNLAFPADGFAAIGGFDESFRYAEDRELCEHWLRSGRRFVHSPEAVVTHMRELSPREFWRQHFGYGRGAWRFHRVCEERDWRGFEIEPGFYGELARQVRRREEDGRIALGAMAATSQLANAAGFAFEAAAERRSAKPTGPTR